MNEVLHSFVNDNLTQALLLAIVIDFLLGVVSALKAGTFQLGYIADFARNDVLGKVLPWFLLKAGATVSGSTDIVIPGLDMTALADAAGLLLIAQMVASILNSVKDLGLPLPPVIAGDDPASPAPPTTLPAIHAGQTTTNP